MSCRPSAWSVVAVVSAVMHAGCLDWNSHARRVEDAGDSSDAAADGADASSDTDTDPGDDAAVETDTGDGASNDSGVALATDAGMVDDADTPDDSGPCPASACPAAFPCVGTAASYTCRGQFADFPVPVRAYTDATFPELVFDYQNDLIFDQRTGLAWERVGFTERINFLEAQDYCTGLRLGNHTDFRVPFLQEMITLYGAVETPGYDSTLFIEWDPSIGAITATPDLSQLYFHFNIGQGNIYASPEPDDGRSRVRCVRTQESRVSGTPAGRFDVLESGALIRDNVTKLVWEADIPLSRAQQTKQQADAYCASRSTAQRVFQLPTPAESVSVVDYGSKVVSKRLAPGFSTRALSSWTSAHDGDKSSTFIVVVYNDGSIKSIDTQSTDRAGTRCVSRDAI